MRRLFFLIFFTFYAQSFSQDSERIYFSSGNIGGEFILEFINDSIVDLRSIPKHMSGFFSSRIKYFNSNNIIKIHFKKYLINTDDFKRYGLKNLIDKKIELTPLGEQLIDYNNKIVFVNIKDYYKKGYLRKHLFFIDGKRYVNRSPKTNGYGIITKKTRIGRGVKKLIRNMRKDSSYYKIERLNGFDAFHKYGIIGLNGVSIYTSKD